MKIHPLSTLPLLFLVFIVQVAAWHIFRESSTYGQLLSTVQSYEDPSKGTHDPDLKGQWPALPHGHRTTFWVLDSWPTLAASRGHMTAIYNVSLPASGKKKPSEQRVCLMTMAFT